MSLTLTLLNDIFNIVKESGGFMAINNLPNWMRSLEDEDLVFIKKFLLASGSLKELASGYGVTYPTVRLRLDRLLEKVRVADDNRDDEYIETIKRMALDDSIDFETAKVLIKEYRKSKEVGTNE